MSNELTTIDPAVLEQVVAGGDLARLTPQQRVTWYRYRCEAADVDPRTQPFEYVTLQGKLVLYARKTCSDQLIARRSLTVHLHSRLIDHETGIAEQTCRVTRRDGTWVEDVAAVFVAGAKGDVLCNLLMKLATKAKRRTVLSACGLGMTDESEIETIQGAQRVPVEQIHAEPQRPALPPRVEAPRKTYSALLAEAEDVQDVNRAYDQYIKGVKGKDGPKRIKAAADLAERRIAEIAATERAKAEVLTRTMERGGGGEERLDRAELQPDPADDGDFDAGPVSQ